MDPIYLLKERWGRKETRESPIGGKNQRFFVVIYYIIYSNLRFSPIKNDLGSVY